MISLVTTDLQYSIEPFLSIIPFVSLQLSVVCDRCRIVAHTSILTDPNVDPEEEEEDDD